MNANIKENQRLLIVDDSKLVRVTARKILCDHFKTVEAVDGEEAWDILAGKEPFSLVISDLSMPKLDGFDLLTRIRNSHLPHIRDLPVIVITGSNDSETTKERATLAGATDFIGKPFDAIHLLARTQAHASAHAAARKLRNESFALEEESSVDTQTRLTNESAFMDLGYQQLAYAVRHNTRLSVFYIEIDHFGKLFKSGGDSIAEGIIQTVASVLSSTIRHEDTAARIGAARFALLLPGLNNTGIQNLAGRIIKKVSERVVKHGDTRTHVTLSIGAAATDICRDTRFDDLLSLAGRNLTRAIESGGNQVVIDQRQLQTANPKKVTAATTPAVERHLERPAPAACQPPPGSKGMPNSATTIAPATKLATGTPVIRQGYNTTALPHDPVNEEAIEITAEGNPYSARYNSSSAINTGSGKGESFENKTIHRNTSGAPAPVTPVNTVTTPGKRKGVLRRVLARVGRIFGKA